MTKDVEVIPKFPPWVNGSMWVVRNGKLCWVRSRYKVFYGGRGSSKSWSVAGSLILLSQSGRFSFLCTREVQVSIKDSSYQLLKDTIFSYGLEDEFYITNREIVNKRTGSRFIFKGLGDIRSLEGIDYCWIEEAQTLSQKSLDDVIPTIRKAHSEIIITFNPRFADDPSYSKWIASEVKPPRSIIKLVNYCDNPFFPEVLRQEMEYDKEYNFDKFQHVWLGQLEQHSKEQIFYGRWKTTSKDISPDKETIVYNGMDFGFSQDPLALISCWIDDEKRELYIFRACGGYHVEIEEHPLYLDKLLDHRRDKIVADNARPEIISYLNSSKRGFNVRRCKKLEVKTGIAFLRNYTIVIHDSLKEVINEFILYKYKVDPKTEEITDIVLDKNNHFIDALRYAVEEITVNNEFYTGYQ